MAGMLDNFDPVQFLQMLAAQNKDPFSKPMTADKFLPQMGDQGSLPQTLAPSLEGQQSPQDFQDISTDFVNTQPGLPNLPDTFTGFGFGQTAPKEYNPIGLRQQLIQQLLSQLPSMQNMNMSAGISMGTPQGLGGLNGLIR